MHKRAIATAITLLVVPLISCAADPQTRLVDLPTADTVRIWSQTAGHTDSAPCRLGPDLQPLVSDLPGYSWGAAADSQWYFQTEGSLIAVDPADGSARWTLPIELTDTGKRPQVHETTERPILEWSSEDTRSSWWQVIDPTSGRPGPVLDFPLDFVPAELIGDVVIGAVHGPDENHLSGFDADTGAELWTLPNLDHVDQLDGMVFASTSPRDGTAAIVARVDPATGEVLWKADAPLPDRTKLEKYNAAVFGLDDIYAINGIVYRTTPEKIRAYDADTGKHLWSMDLRMPEIQDVYPLGPDAIAVLGVDADRKGAVDVINTHSHTIIRQHTMKVASFMSIAIELDGIDHVVVRAPNTSAYFLTPDGLTVLDGRVIWPDNFKLCGDRLLTLASDQITAYALPTLETAWTTGDRGAWKLGLTTPDAVALVTFDPADRTQNLVTVYR